MTERAQLDEVARWLREQVPPASDRIFGPAYRAAVYLKDSTFLPCVCFRNPESTVDLAIRRFEETRNDRSLHDSIDYRSTVKSFTTSGNRLNA